MQFPTSYPVIDDSEAAAAAQLSVQLHDALLLANDVMSLTAIAVQSSLSQTNPATAKLVCTKLARRIVHDLRVIVLLTNHGYPSQALALAASTYEHCLTIAYIGDDDQLAQNWIEHASPVKSFVNTVELTTKALANVSITDEETLNAIYKLYTQFCTAKHGNPLYEAETGFQSAPEVITLNLGPDASELAIREAHFALLKIVLVTTLSLASFITHHVPPEKKRELADALRDIELRQRDQDIAAARKWGNSDPYPGLWKHITVPKP